MIVGYSKLGRSWNLDPAKFSTLGGDVDVWRTLYLLASRNPDDTYILCGRNSGDDPQAVGLPPNVVNPWTALRDQLKNDRKTWDKTDKTKLIEWYDANALELFRKCDQHIVWAGQHGTSNTPIPPVGSMWDTVTQPQDAFIIYCSYIIRGINAWRAEDPVAREEVWLCPDPRNYIKCRDLKWPLLRPVQAQYVQSRQQKFERYAYDEPVHPAFTVEKIEDRHVWVAKTKYDYTRLEMTAVPDPALHPLQLGHERQPFGMVVNENRAYVSVNRKDILKTWVMPYAPDCEIFGAWSKDSLEELGRPDIKVVELAQLHETNQRWRCTLTTPASGSGWATAKPWESFLDGTICFFHPKYDTQGHIIPVKPTGDEELDTLSSWLRVSSPEELWSRVQAIQSDDGTYMWLAQAQRRYLERAYAEMRPIEAVEARFRD